MLSHSDILLDFNHMVREGIGGKAPSRDHIDALKKDCEEIHRGLVDLRRLGQLPFWELPYHDETVSQLSAKALEWSGQYQTILLLGIGGSALGAGLLAGTLGQPGTPRLIIVDDLDSEYWKRVEQSLDWRTTLLMVASKSGETIETWTAFVFFYERLRKVLGEKARGQVVMITDPTAGSLREVAHREKIASFEIPPGVGGRYSILSAVALLPAACLGVDIGDVMAGARRMDERCKGGDPWSNPALMSAVLQFLHVTQYSRPIHIMMPYGRTLEAFAPWFSQLWAESLGKTKNLDDGAACVGGTPISALGPRDQHAHLQLCLEGPDDKVTTFIGVEEVEDVHLAGSDSLVWQEIGPQGHGAGSEEIRSLAGRSVHEILSFERRATEEALTEAGRPNQTILLRQVDGYSLGQLILMTELETVYMGELLGINPFDQPGVERIKRNIRNYLSGKITPKRNRDFTI